MGAYVRLLGVPQFRFDETWHDPPLNKTTALLFYLVCQGEWVSRDELLYVFYPDAAEKPARTSLRQLLTLTRRLLYSEGLETQESRSRWQVESDVKGFKKALNEKQWVEAVELYGGELLYGYKLSNAPKFENWLELERQELHTLWRNAVLALASDFETKEQYGQATEVLERLHKAESFDETIVRRYLENLQRSHQQVKALDVFEHFRKGLEQEFDGKPDHETLELVRAIRQGDFVANVSISTTTATKIHSHPVEVKTTPRHNLPVQPTQFVGREREKAELTEYLNDPARRLLTIVAPGGIGKTRLAIEVARTRVDQFEHGVWFASFFAVNAPEQMVYTIADALDIKFFGQREPKKQLFDYLAEKEILLVLDNLEHLLSGVGLIKELLEAAPKIKILATSRERLHLQAEHVFDLEGLTVPDKKNLDAKDFDSLKLFAQSAKQSRHDFALDETTTPFVIRICTLVAGMPLAIELAASWLRALSITDIAREIEKGIGLLESSARDLPARHYSIRTVFDQSWKLLTQEEQTALRRLSIFQGGFRREAALEIADVSLSVLASLLDKSFLSSVATGRYNQHPLVIQYAREKLSDHPEEKARVEEKHGLYYLHLFQNPSQVISTLAGETPRKIQEAIKPDFANFRAAWTWGVREARVDELRKIIPNLIVNTYQEYIELWEIAIEGLDASNPSHYSALGCALVDKGHCQSQLGHYEEGRYTIERGLDLLYKTDDIEGVLLSLADLAFNVWLTGDYAKSKEFADKGLSLARQHGHTEGIRWLLIQLANVIKELDDFPDKEQFYLEALVEMRQIEDRQLAVFLYIYAFFLVHEGDLEKAQIVSTESLKLTQKTEDTGMEPFILDCMGLIAYKLGDYQKARGFFLQAFAFPEEGKPTFFRSGLLANLGKVSTTLGDYSQARAYLRESFEIGLHNKSFFNMAATLVPLAELSMAHEQPQQAAQWLSLSLHHPGTQRHEKKEAKRLLDVIKRQLSAKELKVAIVHGKRLDLIAVVQDILVEL